jgi:hypothetical protein
VHCGHGRIKLRPPVDQCFRAALADARLVRATRRRAIHHYECGKSEKTTGREHSRQSSTVRVQKSGSAGEFSLPLSTSPGRVTFSSSAGRDKRSRCRRRRGRQRSHDAAHQHQLGRFADSRIHWRDDFNGNRIAGATITRPGAVPHRERHMLLDVVWRPRLAA